MIKITITNDKDFKHALLVNYMLQFVIDFSIIAILCITDGYFIKYCLDDFMKIRNKYSFSNYNFIYIFMIFVGILSLIILYRFHVLDIKNSFNTLNPLLLENHETFDDFIRTVQKLNYKEKIIQGIEYFDGIKERNNKINNIFNSIKQYIFGGITFIIPLIFTSALEMIKSDTQTEIDAICYLMNFVFLIFIYIFNLFLLFCGDFFIIYLPVITKEVNYILLWYKKYVNGSLEKAQMLCPDKKKNGKHQEHIKSSIVIKQKYKKSKH